MISGRYDSIRRLVYLTSKNFVISFLINEYDILKDQLFDLISIMTWLKTTDTQIKFIHLHYDC